MIELIDDHPEVQVREAEYLRLLGYPAGWQLEGRAQELACWAQEWYASHGRPWTLAYRCDEVNVERHRVTIGSESFNSKYLCRTWQDAGAHAGFLVAVTAGPELEDEANRLWRQERPDEYFFLEVFGSAIVEHLVMQVGSQICARAEQEGMAVLPHYSPGYRQWDVAEQPRLLQHIRRLARRPLPSSLTVLTSGMLRPKKSQLAVFGVTRDLERVERTAELAPCASCTFAPCQYRRVPYVRAERSTAELLPVVNGTRESYPRIVPKLPTRLNARYSDRVGVP